MGHRFFVILSLSLVLGLQGCSSLADKLATRFADKVSVKMNAELKKKLAQTQENIVSAMLDQEDPDTAVAGIPAYLILLDSMLLSSPDDSRLLMAAASLYSAYAGSLVDQPDRAKILSRRSLKYASKALCQRLPQICELESKPFEQFKPALSKATRKDIEPLYVYGVAWAGWLLARTDDYSALAELPKIQFIFEHLTAMDERHDNGRAQLYLAVMGSQIPANLGGKPELAREHYEKALKFSGGKDLMVQVKYARYYARLVFNQELHDRLLKEVLAADPQVHRLTLSNVMAQEEARKLKADEYF